MIKKRIFTKIISGLLAVILIICALASCSAVKKTKDGRMDYFKTDMSKLVTISPTDYVGMKATLPISYLVTDEVVDDYINELLFENKKELNGGQSKIDEPVRYGDTAYIYYEGFIDGIAFEGGSNMSAKQPYGLSIGSGSFIDDFEEQLIGIIPKNTSQDDRLSIKVTFPEDYSNSTALQGMDATFLVYVVRTVQFDVPELNDDTIKNILKYEPKDKNATNLEKEYRESVKEYLEAANFSGIQNAAVNDLLGQLMEKANFKKIPEEELNYYHDMYIEEYTATMNYYVQSGYAFDGFDDFMCQTLGLDDGADWEKYLEDSYTEIIKKHMICHAIAQIEGIKVTDDDYENEINYYIQQAAYNNEELSRDDIIETVGEYTIRENAMYSKVCSRLFDNAEIIYE